MADKAEVVRRCDCGGSVPDEYYVSPYTGYTSKTNMCMKCRAFPDNYFKTIEEAELWLIKQKL